MYSIGIAQISVVKGDFDKNLETHCRLIREAVKCKVKILLFPELSLTGYEPSLAKELAIDEKDPRLQRLQILADQYDITILVGAPKKTYSNKPCIGLFIISPKMEIVCYNKIHLHENENLSFIAGTQPFYIINTQNGIQIGLAICADTNIEEHIIKAKQNGATCYLASMLISFNGYATDSVQLRNYAIKYGMLVAMANYSGETGEWACAGKSIIWDKYGNIIAKANDDPFALVIAHQQHDSSWKGEYLVINK